MQHFEYLLMFLDCPDSLKCDLNERVSTNDVEFSSADYGIYGSGDENGNCTVEKGSSSERKVITEFQEMMKEQEVWAGREGVEEE